MVSLKEGIEVPVTVVDYDDEPEPEPAPVKAAPAAPEPEVPVEANPATEDDIHNDPLIKEALRIFEAEIQS